MRHRNVSAKRPSVSVDTSSEEGNVTLKWSTNTCFVWLHTSWVGGYTSSLRENDVKIKTGLTRREVSVLTVAGPMIVTPFLSAALISFRVSASGMPSAMMAMVRICIGTKRAISTPNKLCRLLGSYGAEKLSAQIHNLLQSSQQLQCMV